MPSRKRNQGKQRKAKAASAATATATATSASSEALLQPSEHDDDDNLAQLIINNLSLKKCDHGRPTLADGDACTLFMMQFERALVLPNDNTVASLFSCVCEALHSAADYSHFPSNGNDIEKARARDCLLVLGADFLHEFVNTRQEGLLEQARAVAMAYVLSPGEHIIACQQDQFSIRVNPTTLQKIGDLTGGGSRETISFFAKRLDCSCLKEMYYVVKGDKKTAKCSSCHQTKERKTLMLCSGCKIAQYCCAKCQKDDWPEHKNDCRTGYIRV